MGWIPWKKSTESSKPLEPTPVEEPVLLEDIPPAFPQPPPTTPTKERHAVSGILSNISRDDFSKMPEMPCFRGAVLSGISSLGAITTVMLFFKHPMLRACNWGVASGVLGSIISWEWCQSNVKRERLFADKAKSEFQQRKHYSKKEGMSEEEKKKVFASRAEKDN